MRSLVWRSVGAERRFSQSLARPSRLFLAPYGSMRSNRADSPPERFIFSQFIGPVKCRTTGGLSAATLLLTSIIKFLSERNRRRTEKRACVYVHGNRVCRNRAAADEAFLRDEPALRLWMRRSLVHSAQCAHLARGNIRAGNLTNAAAYKGACRRFVFYQSRLHRLFKGRACGGTIDYGKTPPEP